MKVSDREKRRTQNERYSQNSHLIMPIACSSFINANFWTSYRMGYLAFEFYRSLGTKCQFRTSNLRYNGLVNRSICWCIRWFNCCASIKKEFDLRKFSGTGRSLITPIGFNNCFGIFAVSVGRNNDCWQPVVHHIR